MLMDGWQRISYEKEFISSNTNKLDYCPVCHRCVPYFDMCQYIIKNNTESCLKMCYKCLLIKKLQNINTNKADEVMNMNKFNWNYNNEPPTLKDNQVFVLLNWQIPLAVFNNWNTMHEYINSEEFVKYHNSVNLSFRIVELRC